MEFCPQIQKNLTHISNKHTLSNSTLLRCSLCSDSWYSKIGFVLMTSYAKNFNFEGKIFDSNTTWQRDADNHNMKTYNSNIFSHIHSLVLISIDNVSDRLFNKYYSRRCLLTGIEYCKYIFPYTLIIIDNVFDTDSLTNTIQGTDY